MLRALKYMLGHRARRDICSLFQRLLQPAPDVLFAAGSQVDLQWVIPAYAAAVKQGMRCAFAGPSLSVPEGAAYYDISMHVLRFFRAPLFATATTGLTPALMPRRSTRRVAILHSLVSMHMVYPSGTFDGYTDIFCCGQHHVAEVDAMNRHDNVTGRRPVLIGYGKSELLVPTRPAGPGPETDDRHVLIGPSWGKGNILEIMGQALISRLLAEGYRVTLRPHPSFFIFGDELISPLVASYIGHPAFSLESSLEESTALWTADLMIADYSGFAMEFAFIRSKPVLFVNVPPKVLNPNWQALGPMPLELTVRELIGVVVGPEVDAVIAGFDRLQDDPARWSAAIDQMRERYWVNFGRFGEVCAQELLNMLSEVRQLENRNP